MAEIQIQMTGLLQQTVVNHHVQSKYFRIYWNVFELIAIKITWKHAVKMQFWANLWAHNSKMSTP